MAQTQTDSHKHTSMRGVEPIWSYDTGSQYGHGTHQDSNACIESISSYKILEHSDIAYIIQSHLKNLKS